MDTASLEAIVRRVAAQPHVRRIWLFGSRARGEARERSDIDLAIEAPDAGRREWLEVCRVVEENADTLLPIDLIRLEEVPEGLRARVLAEGKVLFER